jgi:hypothetical protein
MEVTQFTEKPVIAYAEQNLSIPGKNNEKEYYAVFGQYNNTTPYSKFFVYFPHG